MGRITAWAGQKLLIAYAREASGAAPGHHFFENELRKYDEANFKLNQAKLMNLFRLLGDQGKVHNPVKFGDLGGGLFEFKCFRIRMPCAYARNERRLVLITHGFIKKRAKAPGEEIERAWRIFNEDQNTTGLAVISRKRR